MRKNTKLIEAESIRALAEIKAKTEATRVLKEAEAY